jgi:hypothetical protein
VSDKVLRFIERIPGGTRHLGLLDAPYVTVGSREGVPEVEVEMARFVFLRPCRDPAVLDVHRGVRDAEHRVWVNAGLLHQFAFRRAGERDIVRLKMAARSEKAPLRKD